MSSGYLSIAAHAAFGPPQAKKAAASAATAASCRPGTGGCSSTARQFSTVRQMFVWRPTML